MPKPLNNYLLIKIPNGKSGYEFQRCSIVTPDLNLSPVPTVIQFVPVVWVIAINKILN